MEKVCAISGETWTEELRQHPQNNAALPEQDDDDEPFIPVDSATVTKLKDDEPDVVAPGTNLPVP